MGAEVNERVAGRSREKSESVLLSEEKICRAVALVWRAQHCAFPCNVLPSYSPDRNPIENAWAVLDGRMAATKPRGWEMEKAFRRRVRNAVCWLNVNRPRALGNMVASMPHRVAMCLERKGAMTEY